MVFSAAMSIAPQATATLPAVSVLLPVHDESPFLAEALGSMRQQTFSDFELVLVADGNGVATADLARRMWRGDPRLRVLQPGRVGLVPALQIGLAECRAALVARMDSDDRSAPTRLAQQAAFLAANPRVCLVGCQVRCFSDATLGEGYTRYERWLNGLLSHEAMMRDLFVESPLAHPSVMFRRQDICEVGGYRDRGWPEDYDLWLRLARRGHRFAKIPSILLSWRDSTNRSSRIDARYRTDPFLRCKAHHLSRGPLARRRRVLIWGAGPTGRRLGKHLDREGVEVVAFVDIDPKKINRTRKGIPVIPPEALNEWRRFFLLAAVGSRGARELIRARLRAMGWLEEYDFLCVA